MPSSGAFDPEMQALKKRRMNIRVEKKEKRRLVRIEIPSILVN
jgi:hypothetical protein